MNPRRLSRRLQRRHLTESQRAMVAARIANLQPGTNQWTRKSAEPTQPEAAELLNVTARLDAIEALLNAIRDDLRRLR
jgi:hypothetical protein